MFLNKDIIPSIIAGVFVLVVCYSTDCDCDSKGNIKPSATCLSTYNLQWGSSPSPIDIDSSKVIKTNPTTLVNLTNAVFGFLNFTNSGETIIAYPNPLLDPSSISGGLLCTLPFLYKIHSIQIFINQNANGRSAHSIDGKGWPIEVWVTYYYQIYGTFLAASQLPGGTIVLATPVKVGLFPDIPFYPFEIFLTTILTEPYSSIELLGLIGYSWFDYISFRAPEQNQYYAYTGSLPNTMGTTKFILMDPDLSPSLSYIQFLAFKNIKNSDGKPINFTLPIYPQGSKTVYHGIGMDQNFIPII